ARYARPCFVELGDEGLDRFRRGRAIERGAVGELIIGKMRGRLGFAPASPCLLGAEGFRRVGQMLISVPRVERRALVGIGDGRANDKKALGHGFLHYVLVSRFRSSPAPCSTLRGELRNRRTLANL